ncbi:ABC transporter substrate-binding protein [Limibaculum sp. M0105]|uniref:ABC transporter substrate-binding protein n=1 Tax=Thermohalobaculum xanthum TaxID=2753746 RepID=A0A8J7M9Y1_9RHOB|nr:ABC transporter substrate-binding protein [Thermohalobaculum xanthum]MBK0401076.1 ABC transporter substrate-binding protein [Thermohalobaculum xanthum]
MTISRRSAVLALSALAIAAGMGAPRPAMAADDIPVGILLPLSGSVAPIGINNRRGHELAIEEINAAGGIKSLGGAKLVMVDGDTQGNPNVGISEVEKLARRDVVAIMGAYQSGVTFPTTQMAERLGVPYIDPVAIADSITEGRGFKYTFKVSPLASWYARDQIRFVVDTSTAAGNPAKSVVLLHEDTLFGTSTAEGQVKAAKEYGLEVLADISYPKDTPDMTSIIAQVKDLNPDALLLVSYINDAVLITRTMKELGVNIPIVGTSAGHIDPAYITNLAKDADLTFTVGEWNVDIDKAGAAEIAKRFEEKFGVPMNGHAAETYMSTMVLRDALERAGSTDRAKLRDALAETRICGDDNILPYDCIRFGESGQSPEAQLVVLQIVDGVHKTVWPPEVAATKPVWPVPAWDAR